MAVQILWRKRSKLVRNPREREAAICCRCSKDVWTWEIETTGCVRKSMGNIRTRIDSLRAQDTLVCRVLHVQ